MITSPITSGMDGDNISSNMDERAAVPNASATTGIRQSVNAKRESRVGIDSIKTQSKQDSGASSSRMATSSQRRTKSVIQKTKDYKKALNYKNENVNKIGLVSSKSPRHVSQISSDN